MKHGTQICEALPTLASTWPIKKPTKNFLKRSKMLPVKYFHVSKSCKCIYIYIYMLSLSLSVCLWLVCSISVYLYSHTVYNCYNTWPFLAPSQQHPFLVKPSTPSAKTAGPPARTPASLTRTKATEVLTSFWDHITSSTSASNTAKELQRPSCILQ